MLQSMLASTKIPLITCNLAIACFTHSLIFPLANATNINGLTMDMVHRNSLLSPTYNPSDMKFPWDLCDAYRRSVARSYRFREIPASAKNLYSEITPGGGEYYMKISFGSPRVETLALADTGSDLTWIQCKPCISCYEQKLAPFDPTKSSTYLQSPCKDKFCLDLEASASCKNQTCQYEYLYGDGSTSKGEIAFETIAIGSDSGDQVSFPKFAIGCGHDNEGNFDPIGAGIVGLGGGPLSLISQLDSNFQGKFSYCLVPPYGTNVSSKIHFGQNADFSGPSKVSIPLVPKPPSTFYYVSLLGISVGDEELPSNRTDYDPLFGQGNMVVDSGTTFTFVPKDLHDKFESSLVRSIKAEPLPNSADFTQVCYNYDDLVDAPIITFHFPGAELKLKPMNSFALVKKDVACLTIVSTTDDLGILGNIAQINFEVGYDLKERTVSFMPTDCTKH